MKKQHFPNHVKKHPLFHYFIVPASLLLVPAAVINILLQPTLANVILLLMTVVLHLVAFIARDYAKKNQDRIIRAEMRLRYFMLTGQSFEQVEKRLSMGQLLALRFAADEELLSLLVDQQLYQKDATVIKKQIRNWKPDHMRV